MNRAELDEEWRRHIAATVFVDAVVIEAWREKTLALIAVERAHVDRAAQVRALRWAAAHEADTMHAYDEAAGCLRNLADKIERGEAEVP